MKTVIYLIRHAQPLKIKMVNKVNNDSDQIQNEKILLSPKGETQALDLSNKLDNIDSVYSSKYLRTIGTAKYIAEKNNIDINIDERLGERILGTEEKPKEFWLDQMYDENAKTIDGESQKEVRERMFNSIKDILKNEKGKTIAVVTHAASMTFLLTKWCVLEKAELEGKKRKLVFNGEVVIDDSFNTPEVFELIFEDDNIININRYDLKVGG